MQDFLGGGLEAEVLVLVIGGGVKEKRTLRCAAAGGGVAVVPSRFSWSEPTMTERRRGRAGLAGALEERIPPVPELSGDSAKGAGGSWPVGGGGWRIWAPPRRRRWGGQA